MNRATLYVREEDYQKWLERTVRREGHQVCPTEDGRIKIYPKEGMLRGFLQSQFGIAFTPARVGKNIPTSYHPAQSPFIHIPESRVVRYPQGIVFVDHFVSSVRQELGTSKYFHPRVKIQLGSSENLLHSAFTFYEQNVSPSEKPLAVYDKKGFLENI